MNMLELLAELSGGNMLIRYIVRVATLSLAIILSACGGGGDGNALQVTAGLSYPVGVRTQWPSQYLCGAPGPATTQVMQDLNGFWQSSVYACACQYDAPSICFGGGFVGSDPGYIYYDAQALTRLDSITGSRLPADMVMAHEFGHTVQLWIGMQTAGKFRELQADCLAGFYIGSRVRRGLATQADVARTFNAACSYGDPYLAPWYEPGAHGVCQERVYAINQGISENLLGASPGQACP
jgi:predicted metalloprotease